MSFLLYLGNSIEDSCELLDTEDEGVELSGSYGNTWIPLKFYAHSTQESVTIDTSTMPVRGYSIPVRKTPERRYEAVEYICGNIVNILVQNNEDIQFRWVQTVTYDLKKDFRDVFTIDNLSVDVILNDTKYTVISEDFESSTAIQRLV